MDLTALAVKASIIVIVALGILTLIQSSVPAWQRHWLDNMLEYWASAVGFFVLCLGIILLGIYLAINPPVQFRTPAVNACGAMAVLWGFIGLWQSRRLLQWHKPRHLRS